MRAILIDPEKKGLCEIQIAKYADICKHIMQASHRKMAKDDPHCYGGSLYDGVLLNSDKTGEDWIVSNGHVDEELPGLYFKKRRRQLQQLR